MTNLERVINSLETALGVINGEIYKGEDPAFVKGYSRSAIENAVIDLYKVKDAMWAIQGGKIPHMGDVLLPLKKDNNTVKIL